MFEQYKNLNRRQTRRGSQHSVSKPVPSWKFVSRIKQDTQCMYNVTMRRVRATIVAVEKK